MNFNFKALKPLNLPLSDEDALGLRAGQLYGLCGPMYTLRDAGHVRLLAEMEQNGGKLPYGLEGQTIFYAGPTPDLPEGDHPFGAIGPTTASRMDFAAPTLYDAGLKATLGKGVRSQEVRKSCVENGAIYFVTVGGAAAALARAVVASETIGYDDLGTEALRRIEVIDLPVFVGIDSQGNDLYAEVQNKGREA